MSARALLLMPTSSYKATAFLDAAARLGVDLIVGTDRRQALEGVVPGRTIALDFEQPERSLPKIVELAAHDDLRAVLGTDDETTLLATQTAAALGLPHNPPEAVRASRDKHATRLRLSAAGLRCPGFQLVGLDEPPAEAAARVRFPCVLKPLRMSASRGVMRADDAEAFVQAFRRVAAIVAATAPRDRGMDARWLLVEDYIPGQEVALEGLLQRGQLRLLALFDKPDPLEGPTFEETIYVTPSRHAPEVQQAVHAEVQAGCAALGLKEGPVHAEVRLRDGRHPWLLEVAARTIGGLCSRALTFGAGVTLEELILRHALGGDVAELTRERHAAGVMMLPIPRAGILRGIAGLDAARGIPGIEDVTITLHTGAELVPLPEGNRYLGFVFARAESAAAAENALRAAAACLRFEIE